MGGTGKEVWHQDGKTSRRVDTRSHIRSITPKEFMPTALHVSRSNINQSLLWWFQRSKVSSLVGVPLDIQPMLDQSICMGYDEFY